MLLALELRGNRAALATFWRTITALGAAAPANSADPAPQGLPPAPDSAERLATLYARGLLGYSLPQRSTTHWDNMQPRTIAAISVDEARSLDTHYRRLRDIADLYARVVTVTPEQWAELRQNVGGRFWMNDLARDRQVFFARLVAAVADVLDAPDPLPDASPSDK